jgi:hypothetical protein
MSTGNDRVGTEVRHETPQSDWVREEFIFSPTLIDCSRPGASGLNVFRLPAVAQ